MFIANLLIILLILNIYVVQGYAFIHRIRGCNYRHKSRSTTILASMEGNSLGSFSIYTSAVELLGMNPLVLLEFTLAPLIILANQLKTSKEIEVLTNKYQQLAVSMNKTNEEVQSFPDDMRGAIEAYQVLYDSVDNKINKVINNDNSRIEFEKNIATTIQTITEATSNEIIALREETNRKWDQQKLQTDVKINNLQSQQKELSNQLTTTALLQSERNDNTLSVTKKNELISEILQELRSSIAVVVDKDDVDNANSLESNNATLLLQDETINGILFKIKQLEDKVANNDIILSEIIPASSLSNDFTSLKSQLENMESKLTNNFEQSKVLIDSIKKANVDTLKQGLQDNEARTNSKYESASNQVLELVDKLKNLEATVQDQLDEKQKVARIEWGIALSNLEQQSKERFDSIAATIYEQSILDDKLITALNSSLQLAMEEMEQFKEQLRNSNMDLDDISERIDGEQRLLSTRYKALEEQMSTVSSSLVNANELINVTKKQVSESEKVLKSELATLQEELREQVFESNQQNTVLQVRMNANSDAFKTDIAMLNTSLITELAATNIGIVKLQTSTEQIVSDLSLTMEQRITDLNKQNQEELKELKANTDKNIDSVKSIIKKENAFLEGRVQMELSSLKKVTKNIEDEITEKINTVDSSVESRIENVLEERSLSNRINRRIESISSGTINLARRIKSNLKTTTAKIRNKLPSKNRISSSSLSSTKLEDILNNEEQELLVTKDIE